MSLLEQQTSVNPQPAAPTTPAAPAPATEDLDREPEGAQQVGGQRMVPVSALIEERRARQTAAQERDRLAQEAEALRKVKENWDVVEPYLPLLASHPKITGKAAAPAPTAPQQDPELLSIAETFGFYDDAGQPDVKRAKAAQDYMDKRGGARAEEVIRPVARTAAQVQAQILRERAYQVVDKAGRPIAAKEHINAVLDQLSPEAQADPEMVKTAILIARGMGMPPAGEPLHTEGVGGGPRGTGKGLSSLERAAAQARGMTDDQWTKLRDTDSDVLE